MKFANNHRLLAAGEGKYRHATTQAALLPGPRFLPSCHANHNEFSCIGKEEGL